MGLAKARIYSVDTSDTATMMITVQFNPESYSLTRSAHYSKKTIISKNNKSKSQFINSDNYTFSVELLFDTSMDADKSDVRQKVKPLLQCICSKTQKDGKTMIVPKKFRFAWGTFCFTGSIQSLTENYTMFHNTGVPARAKVSISAEGEVEEIQYDSSSEVQEVDKSESLVSQEEVANPRKNQ